MMMNFQLPIVAANTSEARSPKVIDCCRRLVDVPHRRVLVRMAQPHPLPSIDDILFRYACRAH